MSVVGKVVLRYEVRRLINIVLGEHITLDEMFFNIRTLVSHNFKNGGRFE